MGSTFNPESNFRIEAKRAIIQDDLEKLTNSMLCDVNINMSTISCGIKKACRQEPFWQDEQFWNDLPNPNNTIKLKSSPNSKPTTKPILDLPEYLKISQNKLMNVETKQTPLNTAEIKLSRRFFQKWKNYVRNKKIHIKQLEDQIEQREKIDTFFKTLKQYQNQKRRNTKMPVQLRCTVENQNKNNSTDSKETSNTKEKSLGSGSFKHRFKAQQEIIQSQKEKLLKQDKLIKELRLGKLQEEITKSLQETQKEIQDTLAKCSVKIRCKIKPTVMSIIEDNSLKFQVSSSKAPKIVQVMEERALERECKRQMILERKRILDQMKKQAAETEIERKRVQDEEERKKNLEAIKEARRKELETQRQIQLKKQKFLESCSKADAVYQKKLKKRAFKGFTSLLIMKYSNIAKSEECYEMNLKRKGLKQWLRLMKQIDYMRYGKAEQFYHLNLKRKVLKYWFKGYTLSIQHLQVAQDLYELRLQNKSFLCWHKYIYFQSVIQNKNLIKAQRHYNSRILLHYFYLWKSLPAVLQLEKSKEEKKRKWREKVWEILPDFKPEIDD